MKFEKFILFSVLAFNLRNFLLETFDVFLNLINFAMSFEKVILLAVLGFDQSNFTLKTLDFLDCSFFISCQTGILGYVLFNNV